MCKWSKHGDTRIDPCMKKLCKFIDKNTGFKVLMCCCGHGKYPMSIVVRERYYAYQYEICSGVILNDKKRFYKRDKQGYYFIPEVKQGGKNNVNNNTKRSI